MTTRAVKTERDSRIVEMYARNVPVRQIAQEVGLTYGSLRVIAHRLGCTKHGREYLDYRRGFMIPEDKQGQYKQLVYNMGFKATEAAAILDIEPLYRPEHTT